VALLRHVRAGATARGLTGRIRGNRTPNFIRLIEDGRWSLRPTTYGPASRQAAGGTARAESRRAAPLLLLSLLLSASGCGGGHDDRAPRSVAHPTRGPLEELRALPDLPRLRSQILLGDLTRLRGAYPRPSAFRRALAGVWLPDALAAGGGRTTFGFGLDDVSWFGAAGFHPREVAVLGGRFARSDVRAALLARGYDVRGRLLAIGSDGSIDPSSPAGRLVLSALDRVDVTRRRLVAASTTTLATGAGGRAPRMSANPDLRMAVRALGEVTGAVIKPARLILPSLGVPVTPVVENRARWFAAGIDDRGPGRRTLRLALVYGSRSQAHEDAGVLRERLARTSLPRSGKSFGEILAGLSVRVTEGRAVAIDGRLRPGEGGPISGARSSSPETSRS
jgi:hypothetical protein